MVLAGNTRLSGFLADHFFLFCVDTVAGKFITPFRIGIFRILTKITFYSTRNDVQFI